MAIRTIYFYVQSTKIFDHSEILMNDDDPMPAAGTNDAGEALGVTTIRPADGLYTPRTFNGTGWDGTPKEEWLAAHPTPAPEPSAQDKANAALALQIAQNKAAQDEFNAQTMLALAAQNGGTN